MTQSQKILRWFEKNKRPLPWRKDYVPYEVWVSEIMLQQTQMDTVLPYYERWMKNFPTIESLAKAPERKVLKLWQGLGYYSRARNLHHNAKFIVERLGGVFPSNYDILLSLKGIGRYTAGAIASIAFNQRKPIVDGNVFRVLSRLYAIKKPIDVEKNKESFWKLEESMIPEGHARDFNQALMELGALICTSQNPSCQACPLRSDCRAYRQGNQEEYPVKKFKKKIMKVQASAVVFEKNERYFLRRRPVGFLMGGLWEFPEWKLSTQKALSLSRVRFKTEHEIRKEYGIEAITLTHVGTVKRNYTNHAETMHVFRGKLRSSDTLAGTHKHWPMVWTTKKSFTRYPFSAAHAKITQLL